MYILLLTACTSGSKTDSGDTAGTADTADTADTAGTGLPDNFQLLVSCPVEHTGCVGQPSLAADDSGSFLAWVRSDPDGDGTDDDAVVEFSTSVDGQTWSDPVQLGSAGTLLGYAEEQVDVAVDQGTVVVAWIDYDPATNISEAHVSTSTDAGQTFTDTVIAAGGIVYQLALAQLGGTTALAVFADTIDDHDGQLWTRAGDAADFSLHYLPQVVQGWSSPPVNLPVAVAIRPSDLAPFAAWFQEYHDGTQIYDRTLLTWSPDINDEPIIALTTENVQNDYADVALQIDGDNLYIATTMLRASGPEMAWLASSDDGLAWGAPIGVPSEPSQTYGASLDLSSGPGGLTIGVAIPGGTDGENCGAPKLIRTADGGGSFDLCTASGAVNTLVSPWIDVEEDSAGHRQAAFWAYDYAGQGAGLYLYRDL